MTVHSIRLPYTRPPLSLNDRGHWAKKARATRDVRRDVALVLRAARIPAVSRVSVQLVYVPRDNRRRDTDNLVATLKAVADAVVDVGVVPDDTPAYMSKPEPIIRPANPKDPHLRVVITEAGTP